MNTMKFFPFLRVDWLFLDLVEAFTGAEDQRDTPNACQSHDRINDAAEECFLTAEDPGDDIESEKSDASPVQSADDC